MVYALLSLLLRRERVATLLGDGNGSDYELNKS